MTCERQVAVQRHMMDGNTEEEWLEHLNRRLALSCGIHRSKLGNVAGFV